MKFLKNSFGMLTIYLFFNIYVVWRLFKFWRDNIRFTHDLTRVKTIESKGHSMILHRLWKFIQLVKLTFSEIPGTLKFENRKKLNSWLDLRPIKYHLSVYFNSNFEKSVFWQEFSIFKKTFQVGKPNITLLSLRRGGILE